MINEQFNLIYENDPQLKQMLGDDLSAIDLQQKYQILTAYMNGGGIQGLIEDDEKGDEEEIEEAFM